MIFEDSCAIPVEGLFFYADPQFCRMTLTVKDLINVFCKTPAPKIDRSTWPAKMNLKKKIRHAKTFCIGH
ncbi:hypothetical protein M3027_00540 [Geoalkalibacter halelectricus]|nr:hypothetical protein [Geoalkalibacter halelectricus]